MEKTEYYFQLQMMEQEAREIEEQLRLMNQNLAEMESIKKSLEEIEKEDSLDFLANIGKGIYLPAKIKSKELFVEAGNNIITKKSIQETIKIIDLQIKRIETIKHEVLTKAEAINQEMANIEKSMQQDSINEQKNKPEKRSESKTGSNKAKDAE